MAIFNASLMWRPSPAVYGFFFLLSFLSLRSLADVAGPEPPKNQFLKHSLNNAAVLNPDDWEIGGSAGSDGPHVLLSPGVAGQSGYLWAKNPILTNSFEVEFSFQITNAKPEIKTYANRAEGFALWLSPAPLSTTRAHYQHEEWNLLGHHNKLNGLGVYFKLHDRGGKLKPSISASYSDGQHVAVTDIPTNFGVYWQIADVKEPMHFKLTVEPNAIIGQAKFTSSPKWTEAFRLNSSVPMSTYLGFSADGGQEESHVEHPPALTGARVSIWDIQAYTTNPNAAGLPDPSIANLANAAGGNSEALKTISEQMTKMVNQILPRQDEIARTLLIIEQRLENLSLDIEGIVGHIGAPHPQHVEIESLSQQVTKLKQLFDVHSKTQVKATQKLLEAGKFIHEKGEAVHGRHLETLQSHLTKHAKINWAMFGLVMGSIFALVLFVWRKAKEMEKNHLF